MQAFDTLKYTKGAEKVGIPREQAEFQAEQLSTLVDDQLATKRELREVEASLKKDIKQLEVDLKKDIKQLEVDLKRDILDVRKDMTQIEANMKWFIIKTAGGILGAMYSINAAIHILSKVFPSIFG